MFMIHSKFVCAPAFYTVEFILTNDLSLMTIIKILLKSDDRSGPVEAARTLTWALASVR